MSDGTHFRSTKDVIIYRAPSKINVPILPTSNQLNQSWS